MIREGLRRRYSVERPSISRVLLFTVVLNRGNGGRRSRKHRRLGLLLIRPVIVTPVPTLLLKPFFAIRLIPFS